MYLSNYLSYDLSIYLYTFKIYRQMYTTRRSPHSITACRGERHRPPSASDRRRACALQPQPCSVWRLVTTSL